MFSIFSALNLYQKSGGAHTIPDTAPTGVQGLSRRSCIDVSERCVAKLAVSAALTSLDAHAIGLCQAESRSRPPLWKLSGLIRAFSLTSGGPSLCTQAWMFWSSRGGNGIACCCQLADKSRCQTYPTNSRIAKSYSILTKGHVGQFGQCGHAWHTLHPSAVHHGHAGICGQEEENPSKQDRLDDR